MVAVSIAVSLWINFRIKKGGYESRMDLFLDEAVREIYAYTRGYPRSITMLCHKALKALLLENKYVIDAPLIRSIIDKERKLKWQKKSFQQSNSC